jgi:dTDP-4-dehydrorhamnose reductase
MVLTSATYNPQINNFTMDITSRSETEHTIRKHAPDLIIHTAALAIVDKCEKERDLAWKINVDGTENITTLAKIVKAKVVYLSTEYVFDGKTGNYTEEDTPHPINFYGKTKVEGEKITAETLNDYMILRICVLYGVAPNKSTISTRVLDSLKKGDSITLAYDHYSTPTYIETIVQIISKLIQTGAQGIFHIADRTRISRYEFGVQLAKMYRLPSDLVIPSTLKKLATVAQRPPDSSLNTKKIEHTLGETVPTLTESLHKMKSKT